MRLLRQFLVILIGFSAAQAESQQSCPTVTIPVMPTVSGRGVLGLTLDSFRVTAKKQQFKVTSLQLDTSPRRILIVLSNDKYLTLDDRKLALAAAANIVSKARPEDTVALVSEYGSEKVVPFTASRDELKATLGEIEKDVKSKGPFKGQLDALQAGIQLFPVNAGGDILFAGRELEEGASRARFQDVIKELLDRKIRVFALQFGPVTIGSFFGPNFFGGSWGYAAESENMLALATMSGGFIIQTNEHGQASLRFTNETSTSMQNAFWNEYRVATNSYSLTFERPGAAVHLNDLKVDVDESLHAQWPKVLLAYPRVLPACER